ncbi:transmembrane sensor [Rhizobium sp. SG_E_25_P2]|uniref:FecR family protein n=1 Tax=Rhizobium sp. SG_E_25_P2 TaxID=2879942 RepID=UPI0024742F32|nr:FecR family protein [Rhizobium sp. SG_E_25_P2]MDH6269595.1 transmembrane sensor [Rhizobium sp. SG_E_25_P2]
MDRSVGHRDDKEQIEAEAAEWVIRLGGDSPDVQARASFQRWRSQSVYHAEAFEFAQNTWGDLAGLREAPGLLSFDRVSSKPDTERLLAHMSMPRAPRRSLWSRAGIAAICLAAVIGVSSFWYGSPMTMMIADYRTLPGEQRSVTLPDGSVVDLSSASAIALHFSDRERRVELLEGAAYFTAAPKAGGENRPFVVEGAEGTATALGTQFVVDRLPDAVEVTVVEHEVRVNLTDPDHQTASAILAPGQSVRYSARSGLGKVQEKDVELAAAWRQGKLVFDRVPLADVVAELNRYRRGRIVIANPTLANRTVSGVFETRDLGRALATITHELGIVSASVPPLVTLLY